mmetsp:Transcript_134385/g.388994  ORF Transcript_134385/g.388994 Transcript_134385/m.388994 type:complete len:275 (+) Transcript_134385:414-1238(+)
MREALVLAGVDLIQVPVLPVAQLFPDLAVAELDLPLAEVGDRLLRSPSCRGPQPAKSRVIAHRADGVGEYEGDRAARADGLQERRDRGGAILELHGALDEEPRQVHAVYHGVVLAIRVRASEVVPTSDSQEACGARNRAETLRQLLHLQGGQRDDSEVLGLLANDRLGKLGQAQGELVPSMCQPRVAADLPAGGVLALAAPRQVQVVAVRVDVAQEPGDPRAQEGLHHVVRDDLLVVVDDLDVIQVVLGAVLLNRHEALAVVLDVRFGLRIILD